MYSRDTEIRHISSAEIFKLGQILEQTNSWKKLMRIIPRNLSSGSGTGLDNINDIPKKYNNDHVRLIENASIKQNRMSTEILFEEWGTSGRKRPTVGNLLELLIKAELFRAADFVALNLLNESPPERPLKGPAARIDISLPLLTEDIEEVEKMLDGTQYPCTMTLLENAQMPSEMNNKDFYEKVTFDDKKLTNNVTDLNSIKTIETTTIKSDLIKFSTDNIENNIESMNTTTTNNTTANTGVIISENNIPILSELVCNIDCSKNIIIELPTPSSQLENMMIMNGGHRGLLSNSNEIDIDDEMKSNKNIPILSVLNNHRNSKNECNNDDIDEDCDNNVDDYPLPQLSVLNGSTDGGNGIDETDCNYNNDDIDIIDEELLRNDSLSNDSSINSNSSSSLSSHDSNILTPNLSILDQSGGLNDSSLTTVTETSEDSSFSCDVGKQQQELHQQQQHSQSDSFQQSDSNIPCISALNNRI